MQHAVGKAQCCCSVASRKLEVTVLLLQDLRVSRGDKGAIFVLAKDIAMA